MKNKPSRIVFVYIGIIARNVIAEYYLKDYLDENGINTTETVVPLA